MILTAVAVLLIAGAIYFTLFFRLDEVPELPAPSPTKHLEDRKAQIYENLRDLGFEYRLGKLSDADYDQTKTDLQRELAAVLASIDAVAPPAAPAPATKKKAESKVCPHCGAKFARPLKFCGDCGKAMA